jgi:hypothetical protein
MKQHDRGAFGYALRFHPISNESIAQTIRARHAPVPLLGILDYRVTDCVTDELGE